MNILLCGVGGGRVGGGVGGRVGGGVCSSVYSTYYATCIWGTILRIYLPKRKYTIIVSNK
jgi:hypothetical protein